MPHVVERTVHAGIARAKDFVFRQIGNSIAGRVGMTQEQELHTLGAIIENVFVIKTDIDLFQTAVGHILAALGGIVPLLGTAGLQQT